MVICVHYRCDRLFHDKSILLIMTKVVFKYLSIIILVSLPILLDAQCAMCRTQVVNNVSHGDTNLAAGLNLGIMYLFFAPYIFLSVIGYLWYRNAKVKTKTKSVLERIKHT